MLEKEILYNALVNLGDVAAMEIFFNFKEIEQQLVQFSDDWKHYNPRKTHIPRFGLSLTSLDGGLSGLPDLDSLREYNLENNTTYSESSIRVPTPVLKTVSALNSPLECFLPHLGRSHLIKFGEGGYFPPHRDSPGLGADCFRLIALLNNCGSGGFGFVHNGKMLHLVQGQLYFLNTKQEHCLFSFANNSMILVLNVLITPESVQLVAHSLQSK